MSTTKVILPKKKHLYPEEKGTTVKTKLICPECSDGMLEIKNENVKPVEYDNYNKEMKTYEDCQGEDLKYGVRGVLECDNCHEKIVFAGKYNLENSAENGVEPCYQYYIKIEYIERPPHILNFNGKIPSKIQNILINSYKLYWIDLESCANKIRVCLEVLMDLRKIRKYRKNSRTRFLDLQERIDLFSENNPKLANLSSSLSAIRLIGNKASHNNKKITARDIYNGYLLLWHVLTKIYDDPEKNIYRIAAKINKSKKSKKAISKSP
jgi:hypothetical protein